MKKAILASIVLALSLTIGASASEQPSCSEGSHYEGSYVESQSCERVCARKIFNFCVQYRTVCQTVGSWEGSCVSNPVIEEPVDEPTDEPTDDPADETGDTEEEVTEPEEEPADTETGTEEVAGGGGNAWFTLLPKIVYDNYYATQEREIVNMHFLTSYKTEGFAMVRDMDTGIEQLYPEKQESVFHTVEIAGLPQGSYEIWAVSNSGTQILNGRAIVVEIE